VFAEPYKANSDSDFDKSLISLTQTNDHRPRERRHDCLAFDIMDLLQIDPGLSQRKIAERLDISVGQVNFFLKSFAQDKWIERVGSHPNGSHHVENYRLTQKGLAESAALANRVLPLKLAEYDRLGQQISRLSSDPVCK
jgi:DNA-binding MarR family transcriptional regulator